MGLSKYSILESDVIKWAREYDGEPFHSLLTDAPYHLTSINKRFSKPGSKPPKGGVFKRSSAGFMSQTWDGLDENGKGIAFQPETWAALASHLYPGAFGMAFASSRGWHRMAVAIEDAGLIIHPSIFMFGLCYLSGFPKATRVKYSEDSEWLAAFVDIEGELFAGHRYGGQALKPALEPIIVFQRPYEGRPVDNITATGAGSLWIDGGRIGTGDNTGRPQGTMPHPMDWGNKSSDEVFQTDSHPSGRWPSNLILQHHPLCNAACVPGCGVRALDEQSGILHSGKIEAHHKGHGWTADGSNEGWKREAHNDYEQTERGFGDSGPASRMFYRASWQYEVAEQLANATPLRYEPKASSTEREIGLDGFEAKRLTEQDKWAARDRRAGTDRNPAEWTKEPVRNNHPTVKAISLTKYLATLLLPPAAYAPRRILIPFSGVASECIGATLAGWEEVTGIESSPEYCQIARARLAWWSQWPGWGQTDVDKILAVTEERLQPSLFG